MYRIHRHCRACDSDDLTSVFNLGIQPLANDFCGQHDEHAGYAPLEVLFCNQCSLGQLSVVVNPEIMFSKYSYVTSTSATMDRHFDALYADIIEQQGSLGSVLEIGSNDGRFLRYLKEHGAKSILGVDPATNLAAAANISGVPTLAKQFDIASAEQIHHTMMPAPDIVIARHVFCHCPNWHNFIAALQIVTGPKTLILIEVPHAEKMLKNVEFDTIYHEHSSYLTIKSIQALLSGTNLGIDQIGNYPIHGGTVGLYLRRGANNRTVDDITVEDWRGFSLRARKLIEDLRSTVEARVLQGKKVFGFGASAKCTVWMNACGFTQKQIAFVVDNTTLKQGKVVPGTDIPIVPESEIMTHHPDYAVLFAWNYQDEIFEKQKAYRDRGGKFIVPVPELRIV